MTVVHRIVSFGYNLLQRHFNVGHPTEQFFLLRCLDVVSPAMLLQRPRSNLEVALKTLCLSVMVAHSIALAYDFSQQTDVRLAMDMLCMLSLFVSIILRGTCMRQYLAHIDALDRLERRPTFRVGTPYADESRRNVALQNSRYLGVALVMHLLTVTMYVIQNMVRENSFVKIITSFPIDLSERAPVLERVADLCYSLVGYVWGWYHGATQLTIIVLLRYAITEFRVFLHSLDSLDDQLRQRREQSQGAPDEERILRELLYEHARHHSQLIVVVTHLRTLLHNYSLVHFSFYMIIVATFMTRVLIIPGRSSFGLAIPLLVTTIYFLETFGMCMLVEMLVQLNRKVSTSLYGFSWPQYLRYGRTIKRPMMLMIMQANMTKDFSAGGLTTVSAELFAKTCRMIYTMMMFMANMAT
uniref:Uncharacterized protein n=2 Tax=Anopheles arabiensis TaxID=7173 RepID=A0A182IIQ7_ANOAR